MHPAAELFPMMSDDELAVLSEDIQQNDLQSRIVLWTPIDWTAVGEKVRRRKALPKEVYLLDGRNLLAAIERISDPERRAEMLHNALTPGDAGYELLFGTQCDPWAYVTSANLLRRHLTGEQKRTLVAKLLKANPERSDRATARLLKVDNKTVAAVRTAAERCGEIPHFATRIDSRGRQRPGAKVPAASVPNVTQGRARFMRALREGNIEHRLDDVLKGVSREQRLQIAVLPKPDRETLAGRFLALLGLTVDELRPTGEEPLGPKNEPIH